VGKVSLDVHPSTRITNDEAKGSVERFALLAWKSQLAKWLNIICTRQSISKCKDFINWKHCFMWTKTMLRILYLLPMLYTQRDVSPKEITFSLLCRRKE